MDPLSPPQRKQAAYEARAQIARALGHPTRLLIIDALAQTSMCISELTALAGIDQSTISRHVALLSHAGIVDCNKHGLKTYCTLKIQCLNAFWSCIESPRQQAPREHPPTLPHCH